MSFAFLIQLGHSADVRSFANNWGTSGQICAVQNVNGKVSRHAHLGITSGQRKKIIDPRNTRALKVYEVDSGCRCFAECWLFLPICKVDQRWHCTLSNQGCNGSPLEQNNETIATNCRNMKLVPQKLSTVGCFAWSVCLYADQLGGSCFVGVVVCLLGWCCYCCFVAGWVLGATRGTQLTYSQIRSVWGTICMRRSWKSWSKSEQEELELSSRIQNEERPLAGSHLLLPPHQDLRAPIWKERKRWILSKFWKDLKRKRIDWTCFPRPQDCPGYHPLWLRNDKFRNVAGN